jgi:hypothetical protein
MLDGISRILSSYKTVLEGEKYLLASNKFNEIDVFTKYGCELILYGLDIGYDLETDEGLCMLRGVDARYCGSIINYFESNNKYDTAFMMENGEVYIIDHSEIANEFDFRVLPLDAGGNTWYIVADNIIKGMDEGKVEINIYRNGQNVFKREVQFWIHVEGIEIVKIGSRYRICGYGGGNELETSILEVESGNYSIVEDDGIRVIKEGMAFEKIDISDYEELVKIK